MDQAPLSPTPPIGISINSNLQQPKGPLKKPIICVGAIRSKPIEGSKPSPVKEQNPLLEYHNDSD